MRTIVTLLSMALAATSVAAPYVPVHRTAAAKLQATKARLYLIHPCRVSVADRDARDGALKRLLPGDAVRVTPHQKPRPVSLVARAHDGRRYHVKLECLSRKPPDYSYRGRGSLQRFVGGLVRDLPRQMERYVQLMRAHDWYIPFTDPETRQCSAQWEETQAIRKHLSWVRNQLFKMAYSGRSERGVLRREADWILPRGEAFIRGFAGDAPKETKQKLKQVYLQLNRLSAVASSCGRLRRKQEQLKQLGEQAAERYAKLQPAHRARLVAEDLAQAHAEIAKLTTQLASSVAQVRAELLALGFKTR